jgi:glucosamine-6-phosphate deaminase
MTWDTDYRSLITDYFSTVHRSLFTVHPDTVFGLRSSSCIFKRINLDKNNDQSPSSQPSSKVEQAALARSGEALIYTPAEKIGVITVDHFPALGHLTALRFLEWVQSNPGGVVSLPTGKTPEYFIKHVIRILKTWKSAGTKRELEENGIDPAVKPDMHSLHFVQIDEFYPIDPAQHNSFHYYVDKFYLDDFGLDRNKALLIDCSQIGLPRGSDLDTIWPEGLVDLSLRHRHPASNLERLQKHVLEEIDQWCYEYEEHIKSLGGIGFFLGGIGPDGHIAFNVMGSDHNSTTRLTATNYETQAASAADLGGIEVARKRHAITIGLGTITRNTDCTAIIISAGEAKAKVVYNAVYQEAHIRYPGTSLHRCSGARFFITRGAAKQLTERRYRRLVQNPVLSMEETDRIVIDLALDNKKSIQALTTGDFEKNPFGAHLLKKTNSPLKNITKENHKNLIAKLEACTEARKETAFLHTAPHHDDIMLGSFPHVVRNIRDASNTHKFAYMTSGFNAVTNKYALSMMENLGLFLNQKSFRELLREDYFSPDNINGRNRDVWQYLDGVAADNIEMKKEGEARRLLRVLMEIFEEEDPENIEHRIAELINYFSTQYAGKKDLPYIQKLKGMIREWEADCLWGYLGFSSDSVEHLRLGFYKGDIFTEEPTVDRDVTPIRQLLHSLDPDVISVALDPEASGPDTHYKVLQAIAEALRQHEKESGRSDIEVWGYRNVWYRFHPSEANLYVPVSLNMFALLQSAFLNAFVSQKDASFPSDEYDGPFSGLAQRIQVEQYQMLKTCLGRRFFNEHRSPLIRATRGFVFLKKMSLDEFYTHARALQETTEYPTPNKEFPRMKE